VKAIHLLRQASTPDFIEAWKENARLAIANPKAFISFVHYKAVTLKRSHPDLKHATTMFPMWLDGSPVFAGKLELVQQLRAIPMQEFTVFLGYNDEIMPPTLGATP
jgi:hypothetical protein